MVNLCPVDLIEDLMPRIGVNIQLHPFDAQSVILLLQTVQTLSLIHISEPTRRS